MAKTFFTIGKTSTESIDSDQPVWVLLPETLQFAVVSTYSRQLQAGLKVLVRLGSAKSIPKASLMRSRCHACRTQAKNPLARRVKS